MKQFRIDSLPRIFEQVAKQIVHYIQHEKLDSGAKLPTERNLSELLQVSRPSVREGIRVLELLKYLDSRQGEGTFVSDPPPFLLPPLVLHQELPSAEIGHYYGIALLCAEKMINEAIHQNHPISSIPPDRSFWDAFNGFIQEIGSRLANPYYLSLFSEVFQLLDQHSFFQLKSEPFSFEQLHQAFQEHNHAKMKELLQQLSKL